MCPEPKCLAALWPRQPSPDRTLSIPLAAIRLAAGKAMPSASWLPVFRPGRVNIVSELLLLAPVTIDHSPKLAAVRIDDEQQAAVSVLCWSVARLERANPGVIKWDVMASDPAR